MTLQDLEQRIDNLGNLIENKTILRDELSRAIFTMNRALGELKDKRDALLEDNDIEYANDF